MIGGRALDAACGLGRGIASTGGNFHTVFAVDISVVGVRAARNLWCGDGRICWVVADVARLAWPRAFFGLVCAFGFTHLDFFGRLGEMIAPGGMFLYEGFAERQLSVRPGLDPAWTATPAKLARCLPGWQFLEVGESAAPPFRLRVAALNHSSQGRAA